MLCYIVAAGIGMGVVYLGVVLRAMRVWAMRVYVMRVWAMRVYVMRVCAMRVWIMRVCTMRACVMRVCAMRVCVQCVCAIVTIKGGIEGCKEVEELQQDLYKAGLLSIKD